MTSLGRLLISFAYKTKPLQTGVKCSWVFYRIKVAWSCQFCMKTDDWLNFHVKFQSIHVNITSTAHHFFFSPFFSSLHKQNLSNKKTPCQTQNKCLQLHTCNVYKYSKNNNIFYMLLTVSNLSDYWMSRETYVTCHVKHALQFKEHPKLRKCSNITLEYVHCIKN